LPTEFAIIARMNGPGSDGKETACAAVRKVVYEFLDAELPPSETDQVVSHIAVCPPCHGYIAFERAFLAVVQRRSTIDQAPPELRDRIRAALVRADERRRQT
jgi:anti-sigma factor (TIGR02949 family)